MTLKFLVVGNWFEIFDYTSIGDLGKEEYVQQLVQNVDVDVLLEKYLKLAMY